MNFDRFLERYFALVVCGLVALVAFFQASGMSAMLGSTIAGSPVTMTARSGTAGVVGAVPISARPILERNPFDSVTGPLVAGGEMVALGRDGAAGPADPISDPYADPKCEFGQVLLIAADGSDWSFASIVGSEGKSILRRVGDEVDGHTVRHLAWDRVWLAQAGGRCQLIMGEPAKSSRKKKPSSTAKRKRKRKTRGSAASLPAEMAAKITKISDTEFKVERSVVDEILEEQARWFKTVRMRPVQGASGEVSGMRVSRVLNGTLLDSLGVKNGDELQAINGFSLGNPQKALEAYGQLQRADALRLKVNRGGAPVTIEINIQ